MISLTCVIHETRGFVNKHLQECEEEGAWMGQGCRKIFGSLLTKKLSLAILKLQTNQNIQNNLIRSMSWQNQNRVRVRLRPDRTH